MILGEKYAAVTGGEPSPNRNKMPDSGLYTFSDVVDRACEGLMEKQIEYSIRRIRRMEEQLCQLERELDDFISSKTGK
jgi:hypothetical protein